MAEKKAERIRLKCRYCGSLNDEHAERCSSCGASL
jgi:ribosomal protein L37E